jgi:FkbM family methyltransferase
LYTSKVISRRANKEAKDNFDMGMVLETIELLPKHLKLPVRFYYSKLRKTLEPELFLLRELVGEGRRAVDIGANRGYYTFMLSKLCQFVEAFEPQPLPIDYIVSYGRKNINCYNVALSNFNGYLELNIPVLNNQAADGLASFKKISGEQKSITVPVHTLDNYNFQNVSFIKIDVEGHELQVIEGAKETILRDKPVLLVEIEQRHLENISILEVFERISGLGYEGSFYSKGIFQSISNFSYLEHQEPFIESLLTCNSPCQEYINNFIFKPI